MSCLFIFILLLLKWINLYIVESKVFLFVLLGLIKEVNLFFLIFMLIFFNIIWLFIVLVKFLIWIIVYFFF